MRDEKPEFPIYAFPEKVRDIINHCHMEYDYPVSYFAAAILCAIAVAIGKTRTLIIKPGWKELPILFLALLGVSGSMKTHPVRFAMRPMEKQDERNYQKYKAELHEWRKNLPTDRGSKPICKQFLYKDFTMEAICADMADNNHGIVVCPDELKGWFASFNQYRRGGGDCEQWLSLFSGETIRVNRKTDDEKILVTNPFACVIGGLQDQLLPQLFSGEKMDNGLFYRFLFVHNTSEGKPIIWHKEEDMPLNKDLAEVWERIVYKVLDSSGFFDNAKKFKPKEYHLSAKAQDHINLWHDDIERQNAEEEPSYKTAIFRKYQQYVFRFSLIFHTLYEACGEIPETNEISFEVAVWAVMLTDYFYEQAQVTYEMVVNGGFDHSKYYDWLNALNDCFTTAQALEMGRLKGISRATVFRYLDVRPNDPFIRKTGHGRYEKVK